jgi:hypothetical protein
MRVSGTAHIIARKCATRREVGMPSAEVRYVRMIGDYILDIMPDSPHRRILVLSYITERIIGRSPVARKLAMVAAIAVISSAATIAAHNMLEAYAQTPTTQLARIVQNEKGGWSLVIVREAPGALTTVIRREPLTEAQARVLMSDPLWAEKALSRHARGAAGLSGGTPPPLRGLGVGES